MSQWAVTGNSTFPVTFTTTTTYPITTIWIGSLSEPESEPPMTTITDLAALEAVPIDHTVRVDNDNWIRTAKGLGRDGVDLALFHFEGAVARGVVIDIDDMPPEMGEWWEGRTRWYYITSVDDTMVYHQSFRRSNGQSLTRDGSSRKNSWVGSETLHRLAGPPSVIDDNPGLLGYILAYAAMLNLWREQVEVNRQQSARITELERKTQTSAGSQAIARNSLAAIRVNLDALAQLFEE